MASTSSSSILPSTEANPSSNDVFLTGSYDVFLSFRGEDTRYSFTDHLYEKLVQAGFDTFRDNEEIPRGEELTQEIEKGIMESKASIVVLSENYANSTWCLDELSLILEQRRKGNHYVLPVFYKVNPSDVRNQNKTFAIQVKHQEEFSTRWTDVNVNKWKAALKKVVDLVGIVYSGGRHETEVLEEIVANISNNVNLKIYDLPPNLIGMDIRVKDINSWLKQLDDEFLLIHGMGGSGKTTLAMYTLYSNQQNFENISFVDNIGRRCNEASGMLHIREQLLNDILRGRNKKRPSVSQGTDNIERALKKRKALIVLDDIDEEGQLKDLLGTGKINTHSKIIITTTVVITKEWFESRHLRCQEYKMELLKDDESLELLCCHAFRSKIPREGFKELAVQAVQYCEGNPLALEVLGSNLSKLRTTQLWKSELSLLGREIDSRIQRVLVRSYNSLSSHNDKELFLHIACFFVGKDRDYVVKILEPDYSASSRIKTLIDRHLLSVSRKKKLKMHRLLQEMGRTIVHEESPKDPAKRSRIWQNKDSYALLSKRKGSETMEGLALDMQMLRKEISAYKSPDLPTASLQKMDNLKLLQVNFVKLGGLYRNSSEHLRWLCWLGFPFESIPYGLYMGKLVAIDMSCSNLKEFKPPEVLQSLQILNLKDSHNLRKIHNISLLPNLETLILWNCRSLVHVCKTIGKLERLALLNMTGCEELSHEISQHSGLPTFTHGGGSTEQNSFSLPRSLEQLFLKDCYLECIDYFPLSFSDQLVLQYLNLANGRFEFLSKDTHLKNLRILDLTCCSKLKCLESLPSTLAELYTYYCQSLEKITFQSGRFTLQEFGYEGCSNLCEIEGFIKLVPIAKLEETDLGHMTWLREHQNHEVCLAGDDELTIHRSCQVQMLYEFNIMSTSLPHITDPNMTQKYTSESASLSFDVPLCPKNRRLKGLNVTFKYKISGEDWAWFSKIKTSNAVDLMYNPKVFGKPVSDEVGIWLSYWPIGNRLTIGDKVNVSIVVISGILEVLECGASLVYTDDEETEETSKDNMDWEELSAFKLSTGAYYLCRRDFFKLMNDGRPTPSWFEILVGDAIDYTEVHGWRKTGRPQGLNSSFTELKTVRCIIHGPQSEEIYKIAKISKSSSFVETMEFTSSSVLKEKMEAVTYEFSKLETKDVLDQLPVASPSSSTSPSSWEIISSTYDVYLSHGPYHVLFAAKLYNALRIEGLGTIKDDQLFRANYLEAIDEDEPFSGYGLSSAVKKRILDSRVSIIVLSEGFASSIWCLNQLLFILERRRNSNHFVFPLFYNVEPSVVRNHQEGFSLESLQKSGESMERVNQWKTALAEFANLTGYVVSPTLNQEYMNDMVKEIARAIHHALYPVHGIHDVLDQPPVASPSSSTPPSSWEIISSTYDVYLSHDPSSEFFASDLHSALRREGLEPIKDNEPRFNDRGLSYRVKKRISNSRASIIVLSKHYAESIWCLNQLLFILEQRKNSNHIVFPVFCEVEPSDVRNHQDGFSLEWLQKLGESMEKVNQWKIILTEVANLSGYEVNRHQAFEIARAIRHALYPSPVGSPRHPTEKDDETEDTK